MRMSIHRLLIACLVLAPSFAAAGDDARVRDELVRLTQALMDAIPAGKAEVWQRTLADDALVIDEFGRRQDKKAVVEGIHPFPAGLSGSIEIRDPTVRVLGDAAVLGGEMFERENVFGQALVVRYIFSNTFVRRHGAWKLLAAIDVTLPTAPPALAVAGLVPRDYVGRYAYGPGRAYEVALDGDRLYFTTHAGGAHTPLEPVAKDVFMDGGDERNLVVFHRGTDGTVDELIERRKFNDLRMKREPKNP